MPDKLFWVWLGGGLGTLARYLVSTTLQQWLGIGFPYGTLGVNLLGCFCAGILAQLFSQSLLHTDARFFWLIGLLGGFTTFSAFGLEAAEMLETGAIMHAVLYVGLSIMLGIAGVFLGMTVACLAFQA